MKMKKNTIYIALAAIGAYLVYTFIKGKDKTLPLNAYNPTDKPKIKTSNNTDIKKVALNAAKGLGLDLYLQRILDFNINALKTILADNTPVTVVYTDNSYIEDKDPTTLYAANGTIIANLDDKSGYFVDTEGNIVASPDGTPASQITGDVNGGIIQEADGTLYTTNGSYVIDDGYEDIDGNTIYSDSNNNYFDEQGDPYYGSVKQP